MTAELALPLNPPGPTLRRAAPSGLRRVPVPPLAPPYDDETPGDSPRAGDLPGALPLPFAAASTSVPRFRVVPATDGRAAPQRGTPAGPWSTRFVRSVLEALAGLRPVSQLGTWATPVVCRSIARRVVVADACRDRRRGVATLRSIHVCAPSADVAEVCAIIDEGHRVRAMALRVEVRGEGWCCTELVVG